MKGSSPTITVSLGGRNIQALLDSGADVSLITDHLLQKIPRHAIINVDKRRIKFPHLKGVTGKKLKILSKVKISFFISTKNIIGEFFVLQNLKYPMLLGNDQLRANKLMLDFATNTLSIQNIMVPFTQFEKTQEVLTL